MTKDKRVRALISLTIPSCELLIRSRFQITADDQLAFQIRIRHKDNRRGNDIFFTFAHQFDD